MDHKLDLVGRYAIFSRSLSDTIAERRKAFFGNANDKPVEMHDLFQQSDKLPDKARDKSEEEIEELEKVTEKAQNILVKSAAVFPMDFFPDSITIDRQKMTVVHRNFFNVKQTVSVQLSDIKNIKADLGPLLGSITVTSEHFINNTQTIKYLPKKEVLEIQQLVQGFIIANNEQVEMNDIDDNKLVELLNQLGRGEAGEKVMPSS